MAAFDAPLPGCRLHCDGDGCAAAPLNTERASVEENVDSFLPEDFANLFRQIRILAAHELRAPLDDRHAAAESAIGLRHFDTDVAAAQHDEMGRHIIEFERLDVSE